MLAQALGILAFLTSAISFQMKTYRRIMIVQTVCTALFALHFALLVYGGEADAITGAVLNGVSMVRDLILIFTEKKRSRKGTLLLTVLFSILVVLFGFITWHSWISLLFITAMVLNTIAMSVPDPRNVRVFVMISAPFAFSYDLLNRSAGGMINEVFAFLSALTALIRYRQKNAS